MLIKVVKIRSRANSFGIGAIGPYAPDLAILVTRPTRKIDPLSVGSHSRPELSCQRRRIGADLGNRACQRRRIQPLGETDAWQGVSSEKQTIPGWRPLQAVRAIGADIDPAHPRAMTKYCASPTAIGKNIAAITPDGTTLTPTESLIAPRLARATARPIRRPRICPDAPISTISAVADHSSASCRSFPHLSNVLPRRVTVRATYTAVSAGASVSLATVPGSTT